MDNKKENKMKNIQTSNEVVNRGVLHAVKLLDGETEE